MSNHVNYIVQHKEACSKLVTVKHFNSCHIAIYNALFLVWNQSGFPDELPIVRSEIMAISKVGSANTYTKILKDLQAENFITYKPSYNPLIPSIVEIYKFDKGSDKGVDKGSDKGRATYNTINIETTKLLNKDTFDVFLSEKKLSIEDLKKLKSEIELCLPQEEKKSKPRKKKELSESELSIHTQIKNIFLKQYFDLFQTEYSWNVIDGASLKSLIAQIFSKVKESDKEATLESSGERIKNGYLYLVSGIEVGDWYYKNYSIKIFNSKFNELFLQSKIKKNSENTNVAPPPPKSARITITTNQEID